MLITVLYLLAFTLGINLLLYGFAYLWQTDKLTDISYVLTFAVAALAAYLRSEQHHADTILLLLVLVWAIRLGSYLFVRIHRIGRDARFDEIRINPWYFLGFWVMQGLTCGIVSIAHVLVIQTPTPEAHPLFWVGAFVAISGLVTETIADQQKYRFKLIHPKQFMQTGLWTYIRHPNYLGELLFWWGIAIAALAYLPWWLTLISPLWISMILLRFSGIPILERRWQAQYGADPAFQAYQERSWRLVPGVY